MEKALEILTGLQQAKSYDENYPTNWEIQEAIAELKALQEENNILKHNYDVQVEYNNTAYKNYTNMVNLLEQRIEAMKPKTCDGCKFRNNVKFVQVEDEILECCSVCVRQCYDFYVAKDNA